MTKTNTVEEIVAQPYKYGFTTEIETEKIQKGLNEDVIRLISEKKNWAHQLRYLKSSL